MRTNILKSVAIILILAVGFLNCQQQEEPKEEISPCDVNRPYLHRVMPWVYEVIDEWLEKGVLGRIYRCDYRDGMGYIFEPLNGGYSLRACDGTVLYEGEKNPIEDTYPELKIKNKGLLLGRYQAWEQEETSDEFLCNVINPMSVPRIKEFIYRCKIPKCLKRVYVSNYKDGVGFLLGEHIFTNGPNWEFLDCAGNFLCKSKMGEGEDLCPDLGIGTKYEKLILELTISLNID